MVLLLQSLNYFNCFGLDDFPFWRGVSWLLLNFALLWWFFGFLNRFFHFWVLFFSLLFFHSFDDFLLSHLSLFSALTETVFDNSFSFFCKVFIDELEDFWRIFGSKRWNDFFALYMNGNEFEFVFSGSVEGEPVVEVAGA